MSSSKEVVASATKSSTGNSGVLSLGDPDSTTLSLLIDITAVGGDADETMDVSIEWTHDGTLFAPGETADVFTQFLQTAGAQAVVKRFDTKSDAYRIVWTLGGTTPQFQFSINAYEV